MHTPPQVRIDYLFVIDVSMFVSVRICRNSGRYGCDVVSVHGMDSQGPLLSTTFTNDLTGNLLALSTAHSPFSLSHPHSTQLMDIARHTLSTARSSVGMGLVFGLGLGRLELNLCQPLRTGGDAHRSWQVFLAMDFL